MIRPSRCAVLPALCAGVLACRREVPPSNAAGHTDSALSIAVNPSTPAGQIALELWQLRPGVTLADWKGLHPDEPVLGADTSALANRGLGSWCAFTAKSSRSASIAIVRAAYFYAPPPPASLAIPDSGAIDLVKQCVLGLVWVNVEAGDSSAALGLADSIRQQLKTLYGAEVSGTPQFFGSAFWTRIGWFRTDSVSAVAALRPRSGARAGSRIVTAFAVLPVAGVTLDGTGPADPWTPTDTFPLDRAARASGLDSVLAARLIAYTQRRLTEPPPAPAPPESLLQPLTRWVRAATPLVPPRRAAALYFADQVLERAMCTFRLCERERDPALAPLAALGAEVSWAPLGATNVYRHTWMSQARALSRDTPLGQRIFLAQLAAGFDFSGVCGSGAEAFRKVIDNGERYLARLPASPIAADVHYLVGEAYEDIVGLARGVGGDYADSSRYGREVHDAARRALAHYAAATRAGTASPAARAAWSRAWWLRAGLLPRDLHFYCVYD